MNASCRLAILDVHFDVKHWYYFNSLSALKGKMNGRVSIFQRGHEHLTLRQYHSKIKTLCFQGCAMELGWF